MKKGQSRRISGSELVLLSGLSLFCAAQVRAASPDDDEKKPDERQEMSEVVVTGTLLRTSADSAAIPIVALDAKELEQNGVTTNPLEILRKSVPAFAGRSNAGTSNANNNSQNTAGGSQLQLRNLPTLVLINGRRVASDAVASINGKNFVDVNQIPASAIDHVDVLTDGASSVYGSDAIGGVVNFILKKHIEGVTAGGRFGAASGDYRERSAYITGGTDLGGWNFSATASWLKSDPLFQKTRSFTSPLYGKTSSIAGVVSGGNAILAPGLGSPSQQNPTGSAAIATSVSQLEANGTYLATTPAAISNAFDVSQYQTLLLGQEQDSLVSSVSRDFFDDRVQLFGDLLYSHDKSYTQWLPVAATGLTVPAGAPSNPLTTSFPGVVFSDLNNPRQFADTTDALRATLALSGKLAADWHWESGVDYSRSELKQRQMNLIYKPNLGLAIAGGYDGNGNPAAGGAYSKVYGGYSVANPLVLVPALDPFARAGLNDTTLANLYGTEVINGTSQLLSWDAKVDGTVVELPAGDLAVAVGAAWRRESLSGHTDPNGRVTDPVTGLTTGNDQQWITGTFADPFNRHRDISSLFSETRIPITSRDWGVPGLREFDLTAAVRLEKYNDAGSSTVPKFGFRWRPFDNQLTLRGTYAKSFVAPSLYAEYGPTDTRQVAGTLIQGVFGPNFAGLPFNGEDGNNPNLRPATSVSRSIGFVFQPDLVKGLSVTADFSSINLYGFAGGIGFNNILSSINTLGAASPFFSNLAVDGFVGAAGASQPFVNPGDLLKFLTNTATGQGIPAQAARLFVEDQFRNLAVLRERSYTLGANYVLPWDSLGTWRLSTNGAIFKSFKFQDLATHPFIEYAGASNNTGVFGGTLPKYRFFSTVDWAYRNLDVTLNNTYVSGTNDTGANGTTSPAIPVASYLAWDLRIAYDWHLSNEQAGRVVTTALGANNFTNRMPPLAPRAFLDNNADVATFSPLGRLIYASVAVTF
ncbi:MAG: TonB-dependent receptor domain-containing protein [Steroidobacteraceae bacterium]